MRAKTFENYLIDRHAEQYTGTDDMMPDDYGDWESKLDVTDVIEMAEKWGAELLSQEAQRGMERMGFQPKPGGTQ